MTFRRILLIPFLLLAALSAQTAPPADLDAWVARAMKEFEVPGIAVAVVKDGKPELAKGYGVRKLGEPQPVDAHTLFGIASNTKAFTAAALAILVDEGKISWDDPVQKYIPSLHLSDPLAERELTIRDTLSHRSGLGLGAGDLLFWPDTDFTREQVMSAVRFIRPASSFRSRYAYSNLMFMVAGQVVPAVTGKSWDDFVRERIFAPLGMNETIITWAGTHAGDNLASPHSRGWRLEGPPAPISPNRDAIWAAAAAIRSNVTDLAKWVTVQLNHGKIDGGKRLFSEAASREMWSPQTIVRITDPAPPLKATKPKFSAYGLGWGLRDYRGRKIVSHTGGLTGMVTNVVLVPEEELAVIVLTNQEEGGAFSSIAYHILDYYLQAPYTDWIAAYAETKKETLKTAAAAERKHARERVANTKPSLALAKYGGDYVDAWYGKATLTLTNGHLVLNMTHTPSMVADLQHWHYDTFKAVFRDNTVPDAFVTFTLNYAGKIESMKMVATSPLADFSFDYHDLLFRPK